MKKTRLNVVLWSVMIMALMFIASCDDKKDPTPEGEDPIASFQFAISETNYAEVTFTNFSQHATSYAWDFGDATGTSFEESPTYEYAEPGTYTVKLVAKNAADVESTFTKSLTITDPDLAADLLTGAVSKKWILQRQGTALGVGPSAGDVSWWAFAGDALGSRPCILDDTYTFTKDGLKFTNNTNGTFYLDSEGANGGWIVGAAEGCRDETEAGVFTSSGGSDMSSLANGGDYTFVYDVVNSKLTINGLGAYIGLPGKTNAGDVKTTNPPASSMVFDVMKIVDGDGVDSLKLALVGDGFAWNYFLVSYEVESETPAIPGAVATANFTFEVNAKEVTFTNSSQNADSYSWDFGDGGSSTDKDPVHTYAADGDYEVVLTATGLNVSTKTITVTIGGPPFTDAAPVPTQAEADVISIYSDAYAALAGLNTNPNWGQATVVTPMMIGDNNLLKMSGLNYQGIDWTGVAGGTIDVSSKTMVHVDIWTAAVETINFSLISSGPLENPVTLTTGAGVWKSFDIPLTDYATPNKSTTIQFKFDDSGTGTSPTIYVDNMYFY